MRACVRASSGASSGSAAKAGLDCLARVHDDRLVCDDRLGVAADRTQRQPEHKPAHQQLLLVTGSQETTRQRDAPHSATTITQASQNALSGRPTAAMVLGEYGLL